MPSLTFLASWPFPLRAGGEAAYEGVLYGDRPGAAGVTWPELVLQSLLFLFLILPCCLDLLD
jgi:hypothetical protein